MKRILALIAIPVLAGPAFARGPDLRTAPTSNAEQPVHLSDAGGSTTQEAKKQYTCPMHPEVVSDKPGNCPKCGMKLVEKKTDKDNTKSHVHDHSDTK